MIKNLHQELLKFFILVDSSVLPTNDHNVYLIHLLPDIKENLETKSMLINTGSKNSLRKKV